MSAGRLENDTMMYAARQLPWHGLGTPLGELDLRNVGAVRKASGLDWRVHEFTPYIKIPDGNGGFTETPLNIPELDQYGEPIGNDGFRVTVRGDDYSPLGVVGSRYHVVQNDALWEFADALSTVDQQVAIETAGSLRGGRTVWALCRLGADPRFDGKGFADYCLIVTSHDGSRPLQIVYTVVRVVCANTLAMATGRGNPAAYTIRHTVSADERIAEAKSGLARMVSLRDEFDMQIEQLLDTRVSEELFESLAVEIIGDPDAVSKKGKTQRENRLNVVRKAYNAGPNADIIGTGMGFVNAVNDLEIWESSLRGTLTREEMQMERAIDHRQPDTAKAARLVLATR